ncbi:uncharacterized protein OCT59_007708 [Rhizophagus irregularis]|uniref:uncharacterized protein n=1 Tax=Rhizophagus irregularis TaxID=588596 RepID=UPI003329C581|nr:hypothetical protein OCT59_007708 [Rhizophagus irregularis]
MACLKIFSGDLPELTNEIIKYFHDDYITLHSCILVNRLWCRLAIPLLWENPFSIHFIQHLDTSNIISSIESWGAAVRTSTTQISNLIKFIYRSLFQIFIENEVNLHSLEVVSSSSQEKDFGFKIGINVSQQLLQLLESVVIYCSKIKILYLPSGLNSQNINSLINLIENIKQNLNYLLIDTNDNHLSSIILQNLGQILPFKLEYLYLSLITNRSDLEAFLKNSQNTFIKILVIKNTTKYESEDIFPYIEEYIIKKKRIKYLAILQTFLTSFLTAPRKNLFDLKDKVDYYKLYDIQVLDCYSSSINIEKFIL